MNDPGRLARLASLLNPTHSPAWLREHARVNYGAEAVDYLASVMRGDDQTQLFVVSQSGENAGSEIEHIEAPAPPAVRVKAAETLLRVALPPQVQLTGGDELPGILGLPQLSLMAAQQLALSGSEITAVPHPDGLTYVVEEETISAGSAREVEPAPIEETVNPEFVEHVLRRTRQNGDSDSQNPEPESGNGRH